MRACKLYCAINKIEAAGGVEQSYTGQKHVTEDYAV